MKASADSDALNLVSLPICLAFELSLSNSSELAPDIAFTFDIPASKSAPVLTIAPPKPISGNVTFVVRDFPTLDKFFPAEERPLDILAAILVLCLLASACAVLRPAKKPEISKSKYPVAEPTTVDIEYSSFFLIDVFNHTCYTGLQKTYKLS